MAFQPGEVIAGKYRITRRLGDGGMGEVFEAQHISLQTTVALKFLHADLAKIPGFSERFMQEARISARIRHQHAIQVFDVDTLSGGIPYLVMELLEGEPLQALMDRHPSGLKPEQVIDFALQILTGLEAAHALGIVHRDLKPDNVYIVPGAGGPVLKILDFGIAKLKESSAYRSAEKKQELTRPGAIMGTPEYMAPEQAFSASAASERSDLYSVGVILYEMLCGKLPARGDTPGEIAAQVLRGDVQRITELCHIPDALGSLIHHLMAPSPDERPESAASVRRALVAFATQLSPAGSIAAAGHRASQVPIETTAGGTQKVYTVSTRVDGPARAGNAQAAASATNQPRVNADPRPAGAQSRDIHRPAKTGPAASVAPAIEKTLPPDDGPPAVTVLPPEPAPERTIQAKAMEPQDKPTTTADMEAPAANTPAAAAPEAAAPVAQSPQGSAPPPHTPAAPTTKPSRAGAWLIAVFLFLLLAGAAAAAGWYYQDYWWNTPTPPAPPQPTPTPGGSELSLPTLPTPGSPAAGQPSPQLPSPQAAEPRSPARPAAPAATPQSDPPASPGTTVPGQTADSTPAPSASATTPEMVPGIPFGVQLPPLPSSLPSVLPSNLPLPFPQAAPAPAPQ